MHALKQTAYLNYHSSPGTPISDLHYNMLLMTFPALFLTARDSVLGPSGGHLTEFLSFVLPFGLAFSMPQWFFFPLWMGSVVVHFLRTDIHMDSFWSLQRLDGNKVKILAESRAIMMFLTSLAIFAVDFPALFPRSLCKSELYGFSLMDVGVGLVIFFSSANSKRHSGGAGSRGKLLQVDTLMRNIPVFVLGISKLFFVTEAEYFVSASEYGVHWNFFFTVFVLSLLGRLVPQNITLLSEIATALACGFLSSIMLLKGQLEWQFFYADRLAGFVSANREGIASCFGYFSLQLLASAFGRSLLLGGNKALLLWLVCCYLASILLMSCGWQPCRRLANLPYVLSSSTIALFILLTASLTEKLKPARTELLQFSAGILKGPLTFFLIGNALTGMVNLFSNTLEFSAGKSLILLALYLASLAAMSSALNTISVWNIRLA